jgi:hypothetical protein
LSPSHDTNDDGGECRSRARSHQLDRWLENMSQDRARLERDEVLSVERAEWRVHRGDARRQKLRIVLLALRNFPLCARILNLDSLRGGTVKVHRLACLHSRPKKSVAVSGRPDYQIAHNSCRCCQMKQGPDQEASRKGCRIRRDKTSSEKEGREGGEGRLMEDEFCTYVCEVWHQGPVLTLFYETLDHVAVRDRFDRQASLVGTPRFVQGTRESQNRDSFAKTCHRSDSNSIDQTRIEIITLSHRSDSNSIHDFSQAP